MGEITFMPFTVTAGVCYRFVHYVVKLFSKYSQLLIYILCNNRILFVIIYTSLCRNNSVVQSEVGKVNRFSVSQEITCIL
jgi:hypothetical protein